MARGLAVMDTLRRPCVDDHPVFKHNQGRGCPMTKDQVAQIITARQWQRLTCPCCGADDRLTARESAFDPLALPLEAGDLRLDIQMVCEACGKLVRLWVYEQTDEERIRVAPDDPQGDAAALGLTDLCGQSA
jgi:hypothetical protein